MEIASQKVFGSLPKYVVSFTPFKENEKHLLNYWQGEVPYYLLDSGETPPVPHVDIVSSTCPCAGLSQAANSNEYGSENDSNQWMLKSARFVFETIKPLVYWGENAPGLAGSIGASIRNELVDLAWSHGYAACFYRTKSLLHGVPQVRERTFYFFWKGRKVPVLNYFERDVERIEDVILSVRGNSLQEPINRHTPSKDPFYRYVLEEVAGGVSHADFFKSYVPFNVRWMDAKSIAEKSGHTYLQMADWMERQGFLKNREQCLRFHDKLSKGLEITRRGTTVPKGIIQAFVLLAPKILTHPREDRYITFREALTIMGMPDDFELLDPWKKCNTGTGLESVNHICQNVPVKTAMDMAEEVKAALMGKRDMSSARLAFQHNHSKSFVDASPRTTLDRFF